LKTAKDVADSKAVKKTIVEEVAVQTAGCTPIANISGTVIIPPPTPNMPAHNPAKIKKKGYTMAVRVSHFMSP
jgi:hypothetical protein